MQNFDLKESLLVHLVIYFSISFIMTIIFHEDHFLCLTNQMFVLVNLFQQNSGRGVTLKASFGEAFEN